MSTVETVMVMLLVIDALALVALVMLQQGKGADVGAAFGSGSSNTVFGSAGGASFITRLTVWLAVGFFAISFGLAYIAKQKAEDLGTLGLPVIQQAVEPALPELTPDPEGVDSDIPDL
ncbi:MAG: preprotein translocase subunit SecG [Pseudomonadota bacterium]